MTAYVKLLPYWKQINFIFISFHFFPLRYVTNIVSRSFQFCFYALVYLILIYVVSRDNSSHPSYMYSSWFMYYSRSEIISLDPAMLRCFIKSYVGILGYDWQ